MVIDQSGSLSGISRHDYLPFGEELYVGAGGRSTGLGYSASDGVRQKFTQKERDNETGLDYFGARYYGSAQGRFLGADSVGADFANPQTLNKYQYCLNNPLSKVDRNGKYEEDVHRDLTYALALAAGFNTSSARAIANANQYVDDNPRTSPMGIEPWGNDKEVREKYHFTTEARRAELFSDFASSGSLASLETYLHAEQDSFSHAGFGPRTGHLRPKLGDVGHRFDKTYTDPEKADRMAADTFGQLLVAIPITVVRGGERITYAPVDYNLISPMVQAFNRAKSAEEKQKIINQIVATAQRSHYDQERAREEAELKKQRSGRSH